MKFLFSALSLSLALFSGCAGAKPVVIDNSTKMGEVQAHDGSMIRVGDTYYWVGTGQNEDKSFAFNIYRSTDLKNWTFLNHILSRKTAPELAVGSGARPNILWNPKTKRFVLWCKWFHWRDPAIFNAVVAQCETIDGDYKFVRNYRPEGNRTADCTLFQDDDGTGYYISNGKDNTPKTMNIYKLTPDYLDVEKTLAVLPWTREAPAMLKRNGVYFLITSARNGWKPTQQKYVTATNLAGPWSELKDFGDPICYNAQTTYVQTVSGTQGTSYLWMGDEWRQPEGGTYIGSDYKWLPLSFPNDTTLEMNDARQISLDVETGVVKRVK